MDVDGLPGYISTFLAYQSVKAGNARENRL